MQYFNILHNLRNSSINSEYLLNDKYAPTTTSEDYIQVTGIFSDITEQMNLFGPRENTTGLRIEKEHVT